MFLYKQKILRIKSMYKFYLILFYRLFLMLKIDLKFKHALS